MSERKESDAFLIIKEINQANGYDENAGDFKELYSSFATCGFKEKQVSFARLSDISKYLPKLKSGPLSLYILYVLHAKNETGASFWSIESLAKELQVTKKSITNWNVKLVDLGLIKRVKGVGKSTTTILLPTNPILINGDYEANIAKLKRVNYEAKAHLIFKVKEEYISYTFFESKVKYEISNPIIINTSSPTDLSANSNIPRSFSEITDSDDAKKDESLKLLLETKINSKNIRAKIALLMATYAKIPK